MVSVSKTIGTGSDAVAFEFTCDGLPCTNQTRSLTHLTFDNVVDFTDITNVAVQGIISIATTKQFNTAGNPCPIEGATVCAVNHYGGNEKYACDDTDLAGNKNCLLLSLFI